MLLYLRQIAERCYSKPLIFVTFCSLTLVGCAGGFVSIENKFSGTQYVPAGSDYVVRRGDTLFGIALQADLDYRKLASANNIPSPYVIYPGQKITLKEASRQYTKPHNKVPTVASKPSNKPKVASGKQTRPAPTPKPHSPPGHLKTNVKWHWPISGRVVANFSTKSPVNKGIDIKGELGQSVRAAAAGKVVFAGVGPRGYGQLVIIDHNGLYLSAYANNHKVLVKENDIVQARQTIAQLSKDDTQHARLHFEVRRKGKPVNPLRLLPRNG